MATELAPKNPAGSAKEDLTAYSSWCKDLDAAIEKNDLGGLKALLDVKPDTETLLPLPSHMELASRKNALECFEVMIERGYDIHQRLDQHTPNLLGSMSICRNPAAVEILLTKGIDSMAKGKTGNTSFDYLAKWGSTDSVRAAIKHGARPDLCYPLHGAAKSRSKYCLDTIDLLVNEHNVSLDTLELQHDTVNFQNWRALPLGTPLHIAAREGPGKMVTKLLDFGARLDTRDSINMTPIEAARQRSRQNIVDLLEAAASADRPAADSSI